MTPRSGRRRIWYASFLRLNVPGTDVSEDAPSKIARVPAVLALRLVLLVCVGLSGPTPMYGMDITYGSVTPDGCRLTQPAMILSGTIVAGDYERIIQWSRANPTLFLNGKLGILLDSPGGSVVEAIRIAALFERILATIWIPPFCLGESTAGRRPVCGSACFALIVGAPVRVVTPENVAIHRPYFDRSEYGSLEASSARHAYEQMINAYKVWLARKHVPAHLIEVMLTKSSREAYWLTEADMRQVGDVAPWYEEYVIAKCAYEKGTLRKWADANARGDLQEAERLMQVINR